MLPRQSGAIVNISSGAAIGPGRGPYSREAQAFLRGATLYGAEKAALERDPSLFADIYIMKADGSGQKQLTTEFGYDGGPFFTADGQRIVWRHFDDTGVLAELWTMKLDGSDQRQVTTFGGMNWSPFQHPSGQYFIFSSNEMGFENFELYMVDIDGSKEPVRVTYSDGFDGLPVPSPDGNRLAWTSTRGGGSDGQIYQAQWNHAKALEALAMAQGFSESARLLPGRMIVVTHKTGPNSRMSGTARPETEEVPIKALLERRGDTLVVVGALHLVGERGLIALLEREGLKPSRFPATSH